MPFNDATVRRLQCVHMSLGEYLVALKGTIGTVAIALGHRYCLQTQRLGSRSYDPFARKRHKLSNFRNREGLRSHRLQIRYVPVSSQYPNFETHRRALCARSSDIEQTTRLPEPFWHGYPSFELLRTRIVTQELEITIRTYNIPSHATGGHFIGNEEHRILYPAEVGD